jgi:hypothetical protein
MQRKGISTAHSPMQRYVHHWQRSTWLPALLLFNLHLNHKILMQVFIPRPPPLSIFINILRSLIFLPGKNIVSNYRKRFIYHSRSHYLHILETSLGIFYPLRSCEVAGFVVKLIFIHISNENHTLKNTIVVVVES